MLRIKNFLAIIVLAIINVQIAQATVAEISGDDLSGYIRFLASDELRGRRTGTSDADKAAEYIAGIFQNIGLQPGGENGTYFQSITFVDSLTVSDPNMLIIKQGKEKKYKINKDFIPFGFSENGNMEGEVVFVGYGISAPGLSYDDYADIDVTGKIVLALRYHPEKDSVRSEFEEYASFRRKATTAREKGAKAILIFNGELEAGKTDELIELSHDVGSSRMGIMAAFVKQEVAAQMLRKTGKNFQSLEDSIKVTKKPRSFLIPDLKTQVEITTIEIRKASKNVIGYLAGSDSLLKNEIIVIGAHYDHLGLGGHTSMEKKYGAVHNGADDNASGTSGMLELAEKLASQKDKNRRSYLFMAFTGEELGTLGSQYFCKNPTFMLNQMAAMINLDMIGRLNKDKLTIFGSGTAAEWMDIVKKANVGDTLNLNYDKGGYGPSDHTPFYAKDIPVLFFFTGAHTDYHKSTDDFQLINLNGEVKVLEFVYRVIQGIDQLDKRPVLTKVEGDQKQGTGKGQMKVSFGVVPDFGGDKEGLAITGAREGTPAEAAGLQEGDVIISFAGKKIKDLYDFMYALQECVPDQEVEVVFLRGQEEHRSTVKLTAK